MQFLIVGYGRVGRRTAEILRSEGHNVTIVEVDPEKVELVEADGFDAVEGSGDDESVLLEAGLETTDAIGGLTGDLNVNYAACSIAGEHGCRTVMRIDEDYREEIYGEYTSRVDEVVYPERLGAAGAKTALLGGDLNVLADLTETLTAASVRVPADSPHVGRRVVSLELPGNARVYAHGRANEPMTIPLPQTEIEAGDSVAVVAEQDALAAVRAELTGADAGGEPGAA
ncbi:MAG: TrkA family potassium uptake protein [Haloarculaceae archaeon]